MGQSLSYAADLEGSGVVRHGLMLEVVTAESEVVLLEREWDALFDDCRQTATIFQSFAWARQCALRVGATAKLCVLTARRAGRLVAIAPLELDRHFGLPVLRWAGGNLAIYGDVLAVASVDVGEWLTDAFQDLERRRVASCLFLENVRADALVAPFLRESGQDIGRQSAPLLDMTEAQDFARWQNGLSKNTRRGRKRRLRNLEATGAVSFHFESGGPGARARVSKLFELKRAWAKQRSVLSRTIEDENFETLVSELVSGASGIESRISTLLLDGKPIAIELGFVTGDRYLSYLGAYDPAYHAFSPGTLQLERTLEACFGEHLVAFDLLTPNDTYKTEWANTTVEVVSYGLALSSVGVLQREIARIDVVGLAKASMKRVPQPVRRALHSLTQRQADGASSGAQGYLKRLTPKTTSEWSIVALAIAASAIIAAD